MITLKKWLNGSWERVRQNLIDDLESIETGFNSKWSAVFTKDNKLKGSIALSNLPSSTQPAVLLGRESGTAGEFEEITPGAGLAIKATALELVPGEFIGKLPLTAAADSGNDSLWSTPVSNGLTISGFTQGSVIFAGLSGELTEDNSHLFWDDANNRLGVGTATPNVDLQVRHDFDGATKIHVNNSNNTSNAFGEIGIENGTQSLYINLLPSGSGFYGAAHGSISSNVLDLTGSASLNFYTSAYDATHLFMTLSSAGILSFANSAYPLMLTAAVGTDTSKTGALFVRPASDINAIVIETFNQSANDRAISVLRSGVEKGYIDDQGGFHMNDLQLLQDNFADAGSSAKRFRDGWFARDIHVANTVTISTLTSGKIPIASTGGLLVDLTASSAYTPTNVTTDRSYDANATTLDELADVVGTIIADLQTKGILG